MSLSFKLSKSVLSTISPPIPAAYKWVTKPGRVIGEPYDMSQGVPGTAPHMILQQSLRDTALRQDAFGYCPAEGELTIRSALAKEMKVIYGLGSNKESDQVDITSSDVAITSGCNLAFVATIMAIASAGDEVILPVPWYFNHQMTLTLLGVKPVPLITLPSSSFFPSPSVAASLISSKTRAIALVTPNNPTGAIYSPETLFEFAKLAHERKIALILDETYRDFIVPPGISPHGLFLKSSELNWRSTIISLYSFSKSYRIPGHRLGAITAAPELLKEIAKVLDTLQICAPRLPQLALASPLPSSLQLSPTPPSTTPNTPSTELDGPMLGPISTLSALRPDIQSTALAVQARQRLFKSTLEKEAPKWKILSQGAYYAFVQHPFPGHGSEEVCRSLMEEVGVRLLPGAFFFDKVDMKENDLDRYIRFSVANVSDDKVVEVCKRLKEAERIFQEEFGWEIL